MRKILALERTPPGAGFFLPVELRPEQGLVCPYKNVCLQAQGSANHDNSCEISVNS